MQHRLTSIAAQTSKTKYHAVISDFDCRSLIACAHKKLVALQPHTDGMALQSDCATNNDTKKCAPFGIYQSTDLCMKWNTIGDTGWHRPILWFTITVISNYDLWLRKKKLIWIYDNACDGKMRRKQYETIVRFECNNEKREEEKKIMKITKVQYYANKSREISLARLVLCVAISTMNRQTDRQRAMRKRVEKNKRKSSLVWKIVHRFVNQ